MVTFARNWNRDSGRADEGSGLIGAGRPAAKEDASRINDKRFRLTPTVAGTESDCS
jgi:hypothetical protein